jgi:hypothetical protein
MDLAIFTTVFAVMLVLARIIEHLVLSFINKKHKQDTPYLDNPSDLRQKIKEIHTMSTKVYEIISRVDGDGTPRVYFPKTIVNGILDNNKEMMRFNQQLVERMVEISTSQRYIAEALTRLDSKLDKIKEK